MEVLVKKQSSMAICNTCDFENVMNARLWFVKAWAILCLKNYGKCNEAQRHQTCDNWQIKKLSSVRAYYHTTKCFLEILVAVELNRINVRMNNPVYLGVSMLGISKIAMYEYWYDYTRPKSGYNAKLYYKDTDSEIWKRLWRSCRR